MTEFTFGRTEKPLSIVAVRKCHSICRLLGGWGFVVERWGTGKFRFGYFVAQSIGEEYDRQFSERVMQTVRDQRIVL